MGNSELQKAIEQGCPQAVAAALDSGANIEEHDVHGHPGLPLRLACFLGYAAIVGELLKRGADPHAPNAQGAGAPIRIALRREHREIVRLLVAYGAAMPADCSQPDNSVADRRRRGDRRISNYGPPTGMRERRCNQERRVVSVLDVELSDAQWAALFAKAEAKAAHPNHALETASMVLARARD